MDTLERRALYNLLRMNWLNDPSLVVEAWQVEDYRSLALSTLFDRLKEFDIPLDEGSFLANAEEYDSPEDLTEAIVHNQSLDAAQEDQIYLAIFELWRRLMNEKPSLSILCDELDHLIYVYDAYPEENFLALQDALGYFIQMLNENVDEGLPPDQTFQLISRYFANDIETFLYDFILIQIDQGNESYAQDLLSDFEPFLGEDKWFKLLRMRLLSQTHPKGCLKLIQLILEEHLEEHDLEFNLEFLSFLSAAPDIGSFDFLLQQTLPLIQKEEDFHDLLAIIVDHLHDFNRLDEEAYFRHLLDKRLSRSPQELLSPHDPDLQALAQLLSKT